MNTNRLPTVIILLTSFRGLLNVYVIDNYSYHFYTLYCVILDKMDRK
jgi:hypothetical protein